MEIEGQYAVFTSIKGICLSNSAIDPQEWDVAAGNRCTYEGNIFMTRDCCIITFWARDRDTVLSATSGESVLRGSSAAVDSCLVA